MSSFVDYVCGYSGRGLVCISFLLNAVWILYVVLEMREFGLYSFVRPALISFSLVSVPIRFIIWCKILCSVNALDHNSF
ncbi:unnamed protein product [Schistosoma mattheei]|uniref:Uncharacterized protein n=1 Tax=Schistosoma mattheei TaxID=31246 RepID=A0A183PRT5_9TREM|nr:unnamed protein product [Schistosoma mattheei]